MGVHRWWQAAACVAASVIVAGASFGTVAAQGIGGLLSGSATTGAPDWVRPGTRLTFYTAGASIANADFQWQQDDNGTWQDPATGTRYSQVDAATASGEGFLEVDVIGIDGPDVALQWTLYGIDRTAGRFYGGQAGGAREPGAAPEEYWIHPTLLAGIPESDLPDLRILRGDYTVGGDTYHGLGILNPAPERYSSLIYDLQTGLLLSATTRTQGVGSPLHLEGQAPPDANTQLTIVRLAGMRQRDPGGLDAAIPDGLRPGTTLRYTGTWTFVNPYDTAGTPITYPMRMTVTLSAGGPTWMGYRTDTGIDMDGLVNTSQGAGVAAGSGPYWIAPAALAAAHEGLVIDEDPVTAQRVTVASVGSDTPGGTVTIASDMAGLSSRGIYDRTTGMLQAVTRTEVGSGITVDLRLDSIE